MRMRLGLGLTVAVALMVTVLSCASPTPAFRGGPRLQVEPGEINFGTLATGTSTTKQLTLKNVGDAPLVVDKVLGRVVEGCCPPLFEEKQKTIPPGKAESIPFTLKMSSDMPGPHRFELLIYSNDPIQPVATLMVQGEFINP